MTCTLQVQVIDGCGPVDDTVTDERFTALEQGKGRDLCIRVCVVDRLGAPFDLTGGSASLCIKPPAEHCAVAVTKAGVLDTNPSNCVTFTILALDIAAQAAGVYIYEAIFTPAAANPLTLLGVASFRILDTIC